MSKPAIAKAEKAAKKSKRSTQEAEENAKPAKRAKTADELAPRATKSVLNLEEKSFPRGGASVLTPIERKQIQIEADRDALFEESGKKRPLPADVSDDEDADTPQGKENEGKPKKKRRKEKVSGVKTDEVEKIERIESLSFRKLVPGSLVLGQVTQVTSRDVALALPNSLVGYVPLTAISRQLTSRVEKLLEEAENDGEDSGLEEEFEDVDIKKLFSIGQYLRASVVSNDDMQGGKHKKHIELSLDPRLANAGLTKDDLVVNSTVQASVTSVEDGGLVMDLGIEDINAKGFIGANEVGAGIKHNDIEEGTVLLCLVTGHSGNGRVIKLSADVAKMGALKKGGHALTNAPSITTFLPGTAANVLVSDVTLQGIRGTIMGMLDVTADLVHAGGAQGRQDLEKKYKPGSKVQARILFSFPRNEAQKIGVSLVDHVLSLSSKPLTNKQGVSPLTQLPLSSIVEEAKVVQVDSRNGVYLDVGVPRVYAFAHISRLSDKKVDTGLSPDVGPYKLDSVHRARVLGYSPIDGLFSVSLEESTLNQPFLRMEDVQPGEIVDGTIEDLPIKGDGVSGILLRLAEGIRGFVPADHMSDIRLKHPERKFRPGMKVKARVLNTRLEKKSIYLTLKKSLVGSEAEPWTGFEGLKIGDQSPGSITKVLPHGAWVQFYGDVNGFLPVREMSEAFIKDPSEHFRVGQVVNVHIISVDHDSKRMLVTCKDPAGLTEEQEKKFKDLRVGQIVDGSIVELTGDLITLELDGGVQGHLRVSHLTDDSEKKNKAALGKMRAAMKLKDLVILQKLEGSRAVRLSNKPSIVSAARGGKLLISLDQLKQGEKVDGFVSSITTTGIFVEFGNKFTGLIPVAGMSDAMRREKMQNFGIMIGQSISAWIWNIYVEDKRFTLTLREEELVHAAKEESKVARPGSKAPRQLGNPVDEKLTTIDELTIGKQTLARINAVKDLQLNISLAENVNGRIHITELFKHFDQIGDSNRPLKSFKNSAVLPVVVTGLHEAKTYKFLPISHRQNVHPVFECSHKQADTGSPESLSLLKLKEGEERLAFIIKYTGSHALASLSPDVNGAIDVVDLAGLNVDYQKAFPIGCALSVKVRKVDVEKSKVHLIPTGAKSWSDQSFKVGKVYVGHVRRSHADGIDVQLGKNAWGLVPLTELADDYEQARPEMYKSRDAIKVKILASLEHQEALVLSARPSLTSTTTVKAKDRHVEGNDNLKSCEVIRGFVKKVSNKGMLVRLGWNTTAQVPVHELADEYVKNFENAFKPRMLVTGKITKADAEEGHHKMSLRNSVVKNDKFRPELNFADMELGQIVDAVVVKVESYGVFILVENSRNIRGLCHVKELASTRVEDPSKLYSPGDKVKAKIIKLDKSKRHVNFSLKAMHFQNLTEEEGGAEADGGVLVEEDENMEDVDLEDVRDVESEEEEEEDEASEGDDTMEDVAEQRLASKQRSSTGGLKTSGFDWTGTADAEEENAAQLEAEQDLPAKKKRRKAEIQVDWTGDLDKLGPQSVSDFERLLLGQPNSSSLWIQYMAFQLGLSEVDKGRELAERALKTIHMREEEEKLNIWVALLNLENTYGSEETLDSVYERACQMSDRKEISLRFASIYIDSGKHKEAEALFDRMRKNRDISSTPDYWLNYATFLMTTLRRSDDARALLQRATQALPQHLHAHLISRFGALEFSSPNGDVERGRTVFEGLVDAHKNGFDLWDQYLAQEMALAAKDGGDVEKVRALFERMVQMKMRPKRARYVFKRWLGFEKETGSDKQVARVKTLAETWAEENERKKG